MLRNFYIWGPSLFRQWVRKQYKVNSVSGIQHIIFCLADHFEPLWNGVSAEVGMERVLRWVNEYPKLAEKHRDSNNRPLQHTWFYAVEQYKFWQVEQLTKLCAQGVGEIEMHLHHDNDTAEGLEEKIEKAKAEFSRHGIFVTENNPKKLAFGFIHGDFALNNSRENGSWCGVDNELSILKKAGCYADFTLPAAPHVAQTRKVNSIYYAKDILGKRKSHDAGIDVRVGGRASGDLMLIQGPLALNWRKRKWGFLPRIENGCIMKSNPGTAERADLWVNQHIHIKGRPEWTFIKTHCHGAQEEDFDALLGETAHKMFAFLEKKYNEERGYKLHYVTAREMFNIIKAAESGKRGNPERYKDFVIRPYRNMGKRLGWV
jgi:hypothetical protein